MRPALAAWPLLFAACSGADRNPVIPDPRSPVIAPTVQAPDVPPPTPTPTPEPTRVPRANHDLGAVGVVTTRFEVRAP